MVYIVTVVSSLSECSQQQFTFLFSISAYPAVRGKNLCICKYAWQKLSNNCTNKLTHYLPERKAIAACNYANGRNHPRNNVNDSFGKGFCRTRWSTSTHDKVCKGSAVHCIELYCQYFTRYFLRVMIDLKKKKALHLNF